MPLINQYIGRMIEQTLKFLLGVTGVRLQIAKARLKERLKYIWLFPLQRYLVRRHLRRVPPVKPFPKQAHPKSHVDKFWSTHTVASSAKIVSEQDSIEYLEFFRTYAPLKHRLCGLYGPHDGKVIRVKASSRDGALSARSPPNRLG